MSDYAHEQTEKILKQIERSVLAVYRGVSKSLADELETLLKRFEAADKEKLLEVESGIITEQEYRIWRQAEIQKQAEYKQVIEKAANIAHNANAAAAEIVNGRLPKIYTLNRNFINYTIDKAIVSAGFTMGFVDENTIIRLLINKPDLFPQYKLNKLKDINWNTQKIRETIASGLLQGKPVKDIASDMQAVANMNKNSAILHARTAATSAQNAGRQDGFKQAEELGVKFKRVWIASLDDRTRESHRDLDGQERATVEPFRSMYGKIMYPGDPTADPRDVWRCRCTLGCRIAGLTERGKRVAKIAPGKYETIKYKTYREWEAEQLERNKT